VNSGHILVFGDSRVRAIVMKERMPSDKRREQLLQVMGALFEKARTQADFTAQKIAGEADISAVLFYRLVGERFKELRSQLDGPRRPKETVIGKLKGQVKELRAQVRELKARLKAAALGEIAEAIRLIEGLDEENRMLRSEVRMLRRRLAEGGVVIIPPESTEYRIKRRGYISTSGT
jgi:regulator of replication initiation timing